MLTTTRSLVAAAAAVALTSPASELRFAPAEGTALEKSFVREVSYTQVAASMTVGGEPRELPDLSIDLYSRVGATDVYGEVDGERLLGLERTFDQIQKAERHTASGPDGEAPPRVRQGASPFVEAKVVFTWNEDAEVYDVESTEGDVPDELLAGLELDMDLVGFLPEESVEPGDEWEVDIEALRRILSPGGDLAVEWRGEPTSPDEDRVADLLEDSLDGTITARFEGEDPEVPGLVRIAFEGEVEGSAEAELEPIATILERTREMQWSIELEGVLLWIPERGHMHSLQMEGSSTLVQSEFRILDQGGEPVELEVRNEFTGTSRTVVGVRPADDDR